MDQPPRRTPPDGWRAGRPAGLPPERERPRDRSRNRSDGGRAGGSGGRSRLPLIAGIGLPVVLVLGAVAVLPALGSPSDPVAQAAATMGAGAGVAPVTQQQAGLMLDPRGKHKNARAARQAAAKAKAQAAAPPAAAAVPNPNCTLIVPADPTTAAGLATPFQLTATDPAAGPCNEANVNQSAFVQGAIIAPNGQLTLYDPLIVDQGTQPVAMPAPAQVPAGSQVALWFGYNGDQLTLQSAAGTNALQQGNCVNGIAGSIFGQFGACNAAAFFQAANAAIQANQLQVPPLGTAKDGLPCPTVRDFSVVDQDQSDNVTTHELAGANGQTGQNNAASKAALQQLGQAPVDLANGSDNRLLDVFIAPTLGCQAWTRPNGAQDGAATPSLPLNELQAAAFQAAPVAIVPLTDPMVQVDGVQNANKASLYRAAVGQPALGVDAGNGTTYCQNLFTNAAGIQRVFKDMAIFANGPSPDPAAANNLFTFLAMRAQQSFENLNCAQLTGQANPIALTVTNNVVTAAAFTPGGAAAGAGAGTGAGATASPSVATAAVSPSLTPGVTPSLTPGATPTATPGAGVGAGAGMGAGMGAAGAGTASPVTVTPTPTPTKRHHHHQFPTGGVVIVPNG